MHRGVTLQSPPGKAWWAENRWRYAGDDEAAAAYRRLADEASPWPDWYQPYEAKLPPGTRFQMAIGGAQTPDQPGSFGTFDRIASVADVREDLAVRSDWKPQVDRVVTYEVVRELPVLIGPIGPQVDPGTVRAPARALVAIRGAGREGDASKLPQGARRSADPLEPSTDLLLLPGK